MWTLASERSPPHSSHGRRMTNEHGNGYGSLERSIMMLSSVINDVCFDRALSELELTALQHVAIAKQVFEKARVMEATMAEVIARLVEHE